MRKYSMILILALILSLPAIGGAVVEPLMQEGTAYIPNVHARVESADRYMMTTILLTNVHEYTVRASLHVYDRFGNVVTQGPSGLTGYDVLLVEGVSLPEHNLRFDIAGESCRFNLFPGETAIIEYRSPALGISDSTYIGYAKVNWWMHYTSPPTFDGPALVASVSHKRVEFPYGFALGSDSMLNEGKPF